jgi:two-component system chemotaxis response regulator CheY
MKKELFKKTPISELEKKAEQGDSDAQASLALLYEIGVDVPKADPKVAAKWWGKLAKSGSAIAQYSLAEIISKDFDDTEENRIIAAKLYEKAESAGVVGGEKVKRQFLKESGRGWKVLIVDENPDACLRLRKILDAEGCEVIESKDCKDALLKLNENEGVRLVFSDIHISKYPDFEMIRLIRGSKLLGTIPVVITSKHNSAENVITAKKLGVIGWLVKPVEATLVRKKLARAGIKTK